MIGFNLKYINFKKNQRLPVSLKTQKEPVQKRRYFFKAITLDGFKSFGGGQWNIISSVVGDLKTKHHLQMHEPAERN